MRMRTVLATLLALAVLLALISPAAAKLLVSGHNVPAELTAGETFDVRFELESHEGPLLAITDLLVAARASGQPALTFPASQDGDGWVAQVTLPEPGEWKLLVQSEQANFQMEMATTTALQNALAPATYGQLQTELETLRAELDKQVNSAVMSETKTLASELVALEKQVTGLLAEQDALRAELAAVQAADAEQSTGLTLSWWLAGAIVVAVAAVVVAGAYIVIHRRGFSFRLPARSTAH